MPKLVIFAVSLLHFKNKNIPRIAKPMQDSPKLVLPNFTADWSRFTIHVMERFWSWSNPFAVEASQCQTRRFGFPLQNAKTPIVCNGISGVDFWSGRCCLSLDGAFPRFSPPWLCSRTGNWCMLERHHIEGRRPEMIAENLKAALQRILPAFRESNDTNTARNWGGFLFLKYMKVLLKLISHPFSAIFICCLALLLLFWSHPKDLHETFGYAAQKRSVGIFNIFWSFILYVLGTTIRFQKSAPFQGMFLIIIVSTIKACGTFLLLFGSFGKSILSSFPKRVGQGYSKLCPTI